ncbi:unnamed protein product (macronuclear) [Paramecium tetraurelia]|uniref:Uncharacterized protein n=1 Tax=Paramecium tetraurelia TaxID=5888 RepID=A0BRS8_PARTE|nr:uncharacterized protein GSPATT00031476001 [Paramecium tetraurelia]CAK61245.1 unnamed protein product [Paramecium tetraurelia]|eukprot:XP_001428643.1 hypothetical protein (macronuclear) [Paramecium tetraurelia strain d4-2]
MFKMKQKNFIYIRAEYLTTEIIEGCQILKYHKVDQINQGYILRNRKELTNLMVELLIAD